MICPHCEEYGIDSLPEIVDPKEVVDKLYELCFSGDAMHLSEYRIKSEIGKILCL